MALAPDVILNDAGERIAFQGREKKIIDVQQQYVNALGYEVNITTLTAIAKKISEQKFFTVPFADYVPVRVGEGAWSSEILTYRSYQVGDDFSTGVLNTGADHSRLASTNVALDSVLVPVINWGKETSWSLIDLEMAAKAGNWDLITEKQVARKKNWDLGIQEVAFWGLTGNPAVTGLLTMAGINSNTSLITQTISSMTTSQFQTLLQGIIEAYRSNAQRTAMPTHFIIPEGDYNGLAVAANEEFPLQSKLERLEAVFKTITRNKNFQVLPCAYADESNNSAVVGLNKNRYTLLNYDDTSLRMDLPVDYSTTLQNTINGFHWQNVGYGQFTGVNPYRPREILYFDYAT